MKSNMHQMKHVYQGLLARRFNRQLKKAKQGNRMNEIMNIDRINEIKRAAVIEMVEAVRKRDFVNRLIIFGSSVRDDCREDSDIDICVDVTAGYEMGREMYDLHVDLCRPCDGICDILIYHRLRGRIKEVIDQTGVVVYQRLNQSVQEIQ